MATVQVGYDAAGTALDYSTIAAAIAGITAGDTIEVWYSDTSGCRFWQVSATVSINTACTIVGGIPNRQITISTLSTANNLFIASASGVVVTNLTIMNSRTAVLALVGATSTVTVSNISVFGSNYALWTYNTILVAENCEVCGSQIAYRTESGTFIGKNCTAFNNSVGFALTTGAAITNCVSICNGTDYSGPADPTSSNNVSSDGSHPGTSGATISADSSGIGRFGANGTYIVTGRVTDPASALLTGGVDVGLTADIDGQSYDVGVFPRGCTAVAIRPYVADFPAVGNVLTRDTVDNVTGTYVPADEAKYLDGEQYGTDGTEFTGTLSPGDIPDPLISLSLVSENDGSITVNVITPNPTDIVYLMQRTTGEWQAAGTRVGSGDVTISGSNTVAIQVQGYINNASCDSLWSIPVIGTPKSASYKLATNPDWARWIFASISKHFNDRKGDLTLFIEGQYRNLPQPKDFIELRVDGPYFTEVNKNYYKLYVEVNVLIQSRMDDENYHRIYTDIGNVSAMFSTISLYKYGSALTDTQEQFGCLTLLNNPQSRDRIQVNNFGQIDPKVRLCQATVEGHYEVYLQGE